MVSTPKHHQSRVRACTEDAFMSVWRKIPRATESVQCTHRRWTDLNPNYVSLPRPGDGVEHIIVGTFFPFFLHNSLPVHGCRIQKVHSENSFEATAATTAFPPQSVAFAGGLGTKSTH